MNNKQIKAIVDNHIAAIKSNTFTNPRVTNANEVRQKMLEGHTFSEVVRYIESNYISITSMLIHRQFKDLTQAYVKGLRKGIKKIMA